MLAVCKGFNLRCCRCNCMEYWLGPATFYNFAEPCSLNPTGCKRAAVLANIAQSISRSVTPSDSLLRKAHLGFFGLVSGFGLGLIVVRASGLRCLASEGCRLLAPKTSCITTTSPFGFRVPHNSKTPNPTPMSTGHPRSARPKHWNRPWALARGPSTN